MSSPTDKLPVTEPLSGSCSMDNISSQLANQQPPGHAADYPSMVNVYSSDNVHVGPKNIYKGNVSITHIVLPDGQSLVSGADGSDEQLDDKLPEKIISNGDFICQTQGQVFNISNGRIPTTSPLIRIETKDEKTPKIFQKSFVVYASIAVCFILLSTVIYLLKFGIHAHSSDGSYSGSYNKGVLTLVDRSQWKAQPTVGPSLAKLAHPIKYVLIEHTATYSCLTNIGCELLVQSIQHNHINNDDIGDDIGYNFLIGGNGLVYEGRGWDTIGAHARGWNSVSIGVVFLGNFQLEIPNPAYFDALDCLIKEGVKLKKVAENYRLVDVSQVQSTYSPGKNVIAEIKKDPHYYSVKDQVFVNDPSRE